MKILIYIIVLCVTGMLPMTAYAQNIGLEIAPELTTVYAKPGSTINIPIVVKNTGNQGSFTAKGVWLQTQGNQGALVPSFELPHGISMNLLANEPFFLPSGAQKKLDVVIRLDPLLTQRDYYLGAQITSIGKKRSEGKSSLAIDLNVFSTVLLTVTNDGNMNMSGYINSFTAGKTPNVRFFDSSQDIPLRVVVHNSGENWTYASGTITISDIFGKKDLVEIPRQRILANSKKIVRSRQTNTPEYTAVLPGIHVGKYSATARVSIEGKKNMQARTITFIAFPFKLAGILLLLGIIAAVIGARANRPAHVKRVHPHQL